MSSSIRPILPGYVRARKVPDFGNAPTNCFDFEEAVSFLASPTVVDEKNRKGLIASPVYIVDPCQLGNSPLKTATLLQHGASFDSSVFASGSPVWLCAIQGQFAEVKTAVVGAVSFVPVQTLGSYGSRSVSAAATAQAVTIVSENLHDSLAIHSAASGAATATLTIEVSVDNTNFLLLDSLAAAATQIKQYTPTTVGAGIALSPLSFRIIRITAGSAGGADTTTLTIGLK